MRFMGCFNYNTKGSENMKKKSINGKSVVELIISCAIFSLMAITIFAIIQFCLNNWRGIEDRASSQAEIHKVQIDLTEELLRSSIDSVQIHNSDYRKTLAFKTFTNPQGNPQIATDTTGKPGARGYILYTLVRPATDTCSHSDENCPHKIILKVYLTNNAEGFELNDTSPVLSEYIPGGTSGRISGFTTREVSLNQYKSSISASDKDVVEKVFVIARNVIGFSADVQKPSVLFTVLGFKHLEAGRFMTQAEAVKPLSSRFVVQVSSEVIPLNPDI
jgi:hypothetical protein